MVAPEDRPCRRVMTEGDRAAAQEQSNREQRAAVTLGASQEDGTIIWSLTTPRKTRPSTHSSSQRSATMTAGSLGLRDSQTHCGRLLQEPSPIPEARP